MIKEKTPDTHITININIENAIIGSDNAIIGDNNTVNVTNSCNSNNTNAFNAYQSAISSHGSDARLGAPGPSLGAILGAVLDALREAGVPKSQQERIFGTVCTAIAGERGRDKLD